MQFSADEVDIHVGQRVRQRREALGISQSRLGRHLDLTFSQVQKYEKGTNRIGAGRLFLIASFLDVPVQYFVEGLGVAPHQRAEPTAKARPELTVLGNAFMSIADSDKRKSVLALVCALAAPGGAHAAAAVS